MIRSEQLISLQEAAQRLSISYGTVWIWARKGIGERKLETIVIGSRGMRTSFEACERFTRYLAGDRDRRDALKNATA